MLHDSPRVVGGSRISSELIDESKRGVAFPVSPLDGDAFQLTVGIQDYIEGIYIYSGSNVDWLLQEEVEQYPYDLALTIYDRPRSNDIVAKFMASRAFILKADFDNSMARANDVSSDAVVFTINKLETNESVTQLGTLTFNTGQSEGVFAPNISSKEMLIMRGETVYVQAPEVRDATLKNVDITMVARLATGGL